MARTSEYQIWADMLARCRNVNHRAYKDYGGRGISVCARWLDFVAFYADMGPRPSGRHSIDRIDNAGDYCHSNCRWSLPKEQAHNRRTNLVVEYRGVSKCLAAWSEEIGIPADLLSFRLKKWKDVRRAFETPMASRKDSRQGHGGWQYPCNKIVGPQT